MAAVANLADYRNPSLSKAEQAIRRQQALEGQRGVWETHWNQVGELVLPRQALFLRKGPNAWVPGEKRTDKIFDSTAQLALERFVAAVTSILIPPTDRWHSLTPSDPSLADNRAVKMYCEDVTDVLFAARYSPKSNFASQTGENFMSLGAFGTGPMYVDDSLGSTIRYRACFLGEIYLAEDHVGLIDTVYRRFPMTARQAVQRFGARNLPSRIVQQASTPTGMDQEFEFLHCTEPNMERDPGRRDYRGMAFSGYYVSIEGRQVVEDGGYRSFPWPISRYVTAPRETYGRSPCMIALADIKMLNEMMKTTLRSAQKVVDPPLNLYEDGALQSYNLRPGALNFGGLDSHGNELVKPMITGAKVELGLEMMQQVRKGINDSLLVTLFQILVDTPEMTATEVLERAQEKGALLAPTMGRQQSEFLGVMIERELDILARAGQLPPMPPELMQRGGAVDVEYRSPLSRFMKAKQGVGILRTIEALSPIASAKPEVLQIFDWMEVARQIADINGFPAKAILDPDQAAAVQQQASQQAAVQNLIAAAPNVTGAVKDLADAHATAANVPQPQPGVGQ